MRTSDIAGSSDFSNKSATSHPNLYSCRSASTGSISAARKAGYNPKTTPTSAEMLKAIAGDHGVTIVTMSEKKVMTRGTTSLVLIALLLSVVGSVLGIYFSVQFDFPAGSSIVAMLGAIFVVASLIRLARGRIG